MSLYTVRGSSVYVGSELDTEVHKSLPVQTYVVSFDISIGFFLTVAPTFELPSKLYGDTEEKAKRFLNTFADRPATTGVLLSGAKGSGKSLAMKLTSVMGLEHGYPTLIVSSAYCGEMFNKFIQSIDQACIMIFDEFEKIYDEEHQEQLLTLFDGTFNSKKLIIVTCNDPYKIDSHMTNRPGRMFYYLKYTGVSEQFIREYCADKLNDQSKTQSICTLSAMFYEFNFDMLKALVEELNRYPNETVKESVAILNINYDYRARTNYDVTIKMRDGTDLPQNMYHPTRVNNPIQEDSICISIYGPNKRKVKSPKKSIDGYCDSDKGVSHAKAYSVDIDSVADFDDEDDLVLVREIDLPMQTGKIKISPDLATIEARDGDLKIVFTKHVDTLWDYSALL